MLEQDGELYEFRVIGRSITTSGIMTFFFSDNMCLSGLGTHWKFFVGETGRSMSGLLPQVVS
jgi:hypothetical protein